MTKLRELMKLSSMRKSFVNMLLIAELIMAILLVLNTVLRLLGVGVWVSIVLLCF